MKKGQNLLEYVLIFSMLAVVGYIVLSKFNFTAIKNYVFMRPVSDTKTNEIKIEAMTK